MYGNKIVDKEQRKKELTIVALDIFAKKGFESTSISDIAEAAHIGKGTLYEYFESKEELIFKAILAWVESLMQDVGKMIEEADNPEGRLREVVRASMKVFISDERTVKLMVGMFQMLITDKKFFEQHNVIRESFRGVRKIVVDILLDGVSKGAFRPEIAKDAEKTSINLLAYMDGIAFHYYMSNNYFNLMEQVYFYLDNLFRSIKPEGT